jgi:hypothetical protein
MHRNQMESLDMAKKLCLPPAMLVKIKKEQDADW